MRFFLVVSQKLSIFANYKVQVTTCHNYQKLKDGEKNDERETIPQDM